MISFLRIYLCNFDFMEKSSWNIWPNTWIEFFLWMWLNISNKNYSSILSCWKRIKISNLQIILGYSKHQEVSWAVCLRAKMQLMHTAANNCYSNIVIVPEICLPWVHTWSFLCGETKCLLRLKILCHSWGTDDFLLFLFPSN